MKVLKYFVYLVVLLVVVGVILPSKTHIERSAELAAPPSTVFTYLNTIANFNSWSPWHAIDPNSDYQFSGPAAGVGATMHWSSDDSNVGQGSQAIIRSEADSQIDVALEFVGMGSAEASYILEPATGGSATTITWAFNEDHGWNLMGRYMGFFMLDSFLGPMYETGLANLNNVLSAQAVSAAEVATSVEIVTEEVNYQVAGEPFTGYIAYPSEGEPGPGILVVHEWWGHNDYARNRAEMLAREGYTAFALDMYGSGKLAKHPDDAGKFMQAVFAEAGAAKARFQAALDILSARDSVQPDNIAAIGYCFGGATVLNMAREGLPLKGVVSFHGSLATQAPAEVGQVQAKVRVYHGNADPFVPEEQVTGFKAEMDNAGVDYIFVGYDDVTHSFTNPGADAVAAQFDMPIAYDAAADADSWQGMLEFFNGLF